VASEPPTDVDAVRWAAWQPSTPYTVGLEEEVMLLDPTTWALAQRANEMLALVGDDLAGSCSAETHGAAIELSTRPHATVGEAITERSEMMQNQTVIPVRQRPLVSVTSIASASGGAIGGREAETVPLQKLRSRATRSASSARSPPGRRSASTPAPRRNASPAQARAP